MSSSDAPVDVGYYAPGIGDERLSAPDYCFRELIRRHEQEWDIINVRVIVHERSSVPDWIDRSAVVRVSEHLGLLERKINAQGFDVLHLNRYFDTVNPYLLSPPTVLTYHGDLQWEFTELVDGRLKPWLARAVEVLKLPAMDDVVFVSDDLRERVERRYRWLSLSGKTICNGLDHSVYRQLPDGELSATDRFDPFVLHVSNLAAKKNPAVLLKAFAAVAPETEADLVICGSGWPESERVDRLLGEHGLAERVHRLGYVPETKLVSLYNRSLMFVFSSQHESFGLPVLEAMACGTPVVTSNVYSIPEITDGCAKLCPPNSATALADAIGHLLRDPHQCESLVERGLERAAEFDWSRTAAAYVERYRSLCRA